MSNDTRVVLIGIGCRLPGEVQDPAALWDLTDSGADCSGPLPSARRHGPEQDPWAAFDADGQPQRGYFLSSDPWAWDPQALGIPPEHWSTTDPHHRLLLEVARESIEHAGIPADRLGDRRVGAYLTVPGPDHLLREIRSAADPDVLEYLSGGLPGVQVQRMASVMGLRGPAMALDSRDGTGLTAVDLARCALQGGDCDIALAGAATLMLTPYGYLLLARQAARYGKDHPRPGEGAVVLVLKRLLDARHDGDRILAVLRGSACGGAGADRQLLDRALARAAVDPAEVGLLDTTLSSDAAGNATLHAVYGPGAGACAVTSTAAGLGHAGPVSDLASVIGAVECLRRGVIPAAPAAFAHATDPRPRLFVPAEQRPWPIEGHARLAAVHTLTAHAILEAAPILAARPRRRPSQPHVFVLSASSEPALARAAGRLAAWAHGSGTDTDLADAAHTLSTRRAHAAHRMAIIARTHDELATRSHGAAGGTRPDLVTAGQARAVGEKAAAVFVFSGQGSQWPGMGQVLLRTEPAFAQAIDEVESPVLAECGLSVRHLLTHPAELAGVERIQPVLFAMHVALASLWRSWGVYPHAVIGQSLGEVAAATVAGALTLADGAAVVCQRAPLLAQAAGGAMASVLLSRAQVEADIAAAGANNVCVAVITSPHATVISGDTDQIVDLTARWENQGVMARMIDVDVASHSAHMNPILDRLATAVSTIQPQHPNIPFYTTVGANPRVPGLLTPDYWVRNQRQLVRFAPAVSAALSDGHRLFIECSPHPLTRRGITDTAAADGITDTLVIGSLHRNHDDQVAFLRQLAALHCAGHPIDWQTRYGRAHLADVPGTVWTRTRHTAAPPYRLVPAGTVGAAQHPLLGAHLNDPHQPDKHVWQTPIGPRRQTWLTGNLLSGKPVLPPGALVEMVTAAARMTLGSDTLTLRCLALPETFQLAPEPTVTTTLTLCAGSAHIGIHAGIGDGVHLLATATVQPASPDRNPTTSLPADTPWPAVDPATVYHHLRHHHESIPGPQLATVDAIRIHPIDDEATATVRPSTGQPLPVDQMIQVAIAVWIDHYAINRGPITASALDTLRVYRRDRAVARIHVRLDMADDHRCRVSGVFAATDGALLAETSGLELIKRLPSRTSRRGTP